jgi:hypothetical protein
MRITSSLLCLTAIALAAACTSTGERPAQPAAGAAAATEVAPPTAAADTPDNASPRAQAPMPAPAKRAGHPAPPPQEKPEPRSEWSIDETIAIPEELAGREILAKFRKDDGSVVIVYRRENGDVYRRKTSALGVFTRVEEQKIELEE